jgi:hypothetical protein
VGYTSLSFATPAASNFAFSPPPGAKVKTVTVPAGAGLPAGLPSGLPNLPAGVVPSNIKVAPPPVGSVTLRMSSGSKVVAVSGGKPLPAAVRKQLQAAMAQSLPASMPKAQRAALLKSLVSGEPGNGGWVAHAPLTESVVGSGTLSSSGPTLLGKGWLSVAVLPASAAVGGGASAQNVLGALAGASTPVHGAWGSGRLLRTSLVSVLLLSDGRVLAGAVVPSVLYADAAQLR